MNDAERRENSSASMDPVAPVVNSGEVVLVAEELLLLAKGQQYALPPRRVLLSSRGLESLCLPISSP
jgi:hypothetical protein